MNIRSNNNAKNLHIASFWFSIKDSIICNFFIIYLLRLNATNLQISIFEPLPAMAGIIALVFFTVYLDNSRRTFLRFAAIDRFVFLVFCLLLLVIKNPLLIIILYGLYSIPFAVCGVLSPNYIKECISNEHWGRVFSHNKMILIATNFVTLTGVGVVLKHFDYKFPYNFIVVFLISSMAYALSYYFLRGIKSETPLNHADIDRIHLLGYVDKNLILMLLVQIPTYMIVPLWSIYHIRILNLNDFQVGMLMGVSCLGGLMVLPYWGRLLDKLPNKKLFIISVFLMACIPIIYMFNRNYYYLLFIQLIIGFITYGYDVILQNNLMESAREKQYDYAYMSNFQIYQNIIRIVFPPLGVLIYSQMGIIYTFLITGALRFVIACIVWSGMRRHNSLQKQATIQVQE